MKRTTYFIIINFIALFATAFILFKIYLNKLDKIQTSLADNTVTEVQTFAEIRSITFEMSKTGSKVYIPGEIHIDITSAGDGEETSVTHTRSQAITCSEKDGDLTIAFDLKKKLIDGKIVKLHNPQISIAVKGNLHTIRDNFIAAFNKIQLTHLQADSLGVYITRCEIDSCRFRSLSFDRKTTKVTCRNSTIDDLSTKGNIENPEEAFIGNEIKKRDY